MEIELNITHLVTFLSGTAVGAAGTYMADRFTDYRRAKESRAITEKSFRALNAVMPDFFNEIRSDLRSNLVASVREFVILPSPDGIFSHSKPRFEYYESRYPVVQNWIGLLEQAGFVSRVNQCIDGTLPPQLFTSVQIPVYRLNEGFVTRLLADA